VTTTHAQVKIPALDTWVSRLREYSSARCITAPSSNMSACGVVCSYCGSAPSSGPARLSLVKYFCRVGVVVLTVPVGEFVVALAELVVKVGEVEHDDGVECGDGCHCG
jgi:hypothetical protein